MQNLSDIEHEEYCGPFCKESRENITNEKKCSKTSDITKISSHIKKKLMEKLTVANKLFMNHLNTNIKNLKKNDNIKNIYYTELCPF